MSRFDALRARLRLIVAPRAAESRADEEIRFHLEMETERLVRDERLDPAEAERRARATFGGVTQHKEALRPARWIDSVAADIRFAFRFFARKPLSSVTIVLVLALGIAGYAAVFGLLQSATMRPPPGVPDSVPLVRLRGMVRQKEQPSWSPMRFSYPELREMSELRTIFSAATAWTESDVVADMPGVLDHAKASVQFVTDGYFSIIGVRPAQGSALPAAGADASAESQLVAVISDAMWEDAFARKDVMNRTVMVNGVGVRIIGVAPPQFGGVLAHDRDNRLTMWLPLATRAAILTASSLANSSTADALSSADSTLFEAVGRLQPRCVDGAGHRGRPCGRDARLQSNGSGTHRCLAHGEARIRRRCRTAPRLGRCGRRRVGPLSPMTPSRRFSRSWEPWRHSCSSSSAPTLPRWSSARPSDAGRRSPSDSRSAHRARE